VKVVVLKYGDNQVSPPDPQQKSEAKALNRDVRARAANTSPTAKVTPTNPRVRPTPLMQSEYIGASAW